jgi:acylphosphatase
MHDVTIASCDAIVNPFGVNSVSACRAIPSDVRRTRGRRHDEAVTERTEPGRDDVVRLTAWVHGQVQGVGFRWWTRARALELGLAGHAANLADGRVEVVAEGPESSCRALLELLRAPGTPGRVRTVVERFDRPRGLPAGFQER